MRKVRFSILNVPQSAALAIGVLGLECELFVGESRRSMAVERGAWFGANVRVKVLVSGLIHGRR